MADETQSGCKDSSINQISIDLDFIAANRCLFEYSTIVLAGPVGVGKSTVAQLLCRRNRNIRIVQNTTTRAVRFDDPQGEMEFIDQGEFERRVSTKEFFFGRRKGKISYGYQKDRFAGVDSWRILMFRATGATQLAKLLPKLPIVFLTAKVEHLQSVALQRKVSESEIAATLRENDALFSSTRTAQLNELGYTSHVAQVPFRLWLYNDIDNPSTIEKNCESIEAMLKNIGNEH